MTRIEAALAAAKRWQSGPPTDDALFAIAELRALRGEHPVAAELGTLLARKALQEKGSGPRAELDEAVAELVLARENDSADRDLRHHLAVVRVLRYSLHAGPEEDFAADSELAALLEIPAYVEESGDNARLLRVQLLLTSLQPRETRLPPGRLGAAEMVLVMRNSYLVPAERKAAVARTVTEMLDSLTEKNRSHPQILAYRAMVGLLTLTDASGYDDALTSIDQQETVAGTQEHALIATVRAGIHSEKARISQKSEDALAAAEAVDAAAAALTDDVPAAAHFRDLLGLMKYPNDLGTPFTAGELPEEIARLRRSLDVFPVGNPGREHTLESFVVNVSFRIIAANASIDELDTLRALYEDLTSYDQDDVRSRLICVLLEVLKAVLTDEPGPLNAAVRATRDVAARFPDDELVQVLMKVYGATALAKRAIGMWNLQDVETAFDVLRTSGPNADPQLEGLLAWARATVGLASFQHHSPDEARYDEVISQFERVPQKLGDLSPLLLDAVTQNVRRMRDFLRSSAHGTSLMADFVPPADRTHISAHYNDVGQALVLIQNGITIGDVGKIDRAIELLLPFERDNTLNGRDAVRIGFATGVALRMRHLLTREENDLDNAITHWQRTVTLVEREPGMADVSDVYFQLGDGLNRRAGEDDRVRAAENGVLALRARTSDVLLQADVGHALTMAEHANGEAATIARWCLAADRLDLAVRALELGRSLVLHSLSAEASISDLLRDSGRLDLAAEWDPESAPSELRFRVLTAIAGSDAASQLLQPPDTEEVREALRRTGSDALAYLVPATPHAAGFALVIALDGAVEHLPLPDLRTEPAAAFQDARRTLLDPSAQDERWWDETMGHTCEWAWDAVMGELLGRFPGLPRIVLVPVGELGAVPWHAARRTHGGRVRYACQDAVITYAASARQFTDAAARTSRPVDESVALVRVQDAGLAWAATEIKTLREHDYPGATTLEDRVRPADVLRHLPSRSTPGASVLHLTCHARGETPAVESHLLLDDGEVLPTRAILRQARHRGRDADGGLVVLASCASDVTDTAHDEALTLATAFIAAGATGAVGARWPIVDLTTTLFVTMFHHYLTRGYRDPATALRATQVWMLDPGRQVPLDLDPVLARRARIAHLDAPGHWAAFTYQGR
ncbi:CHAT domain-containing protein [Lentzea waywayandensis]|uniref:CHAT domain-containing protein n=1 Tax=Lentzea waywayandensis TaxID=84724 RepID=A0A1I6FIH3_9PSEU|nr:CHAT domain-containing protein [Lentzea waywayandensis]SFR29741.1 CHAT domain-containing protein [Lentzea waywayandensis]